MAKEKKEHMILKSAISDLDKELANLRKQKKTIDTKVNNLGNDIIGTQTEEEKLRDQISRLVAKEGILERKRNKLKERLTNTTGKISKVKSIKDQLTDVEEN